MEGAIPASALGMPGGGMPQPQQPQYVPQPIALPPPPKETSIEVIRIVGVNGSYVALINESDENREVQDVSEMKGSKDKTKQIRVGDKLSDGSVVSEITSQGVTTVKGSKSRTVRVKDAGTVVRGW
jgi:hypothetical protein